MHIKQLIESQHALEKLYDYGFLPAKDLFFLCSVKDKVANALVSYHTAKNSMLARYGTSEDGVSYAITGDEAIAEYEREIFELESQEVDISFPPEKITLCIESIDKTEKDLTADKRLGFSANDWAAIRGIITVTENEE